MFFPSSIYVYFLPYNDGTDMGPRRVPEGNTIHHLKIQVSVF